MVSFHRVLEFDDFWIQKCENVISRTLKNFCSNKSDKQSIDYVKQKINLSC